MNTFTRLGLGIISLALPILALAAPPNVGGITAVNENGKVRVTWDLVQSTNITSYRIFYSHASILRNSGLYDDFESVSGTVNTHLLQNIPPANEIFVSVLAVNNKGEESSYFVEEARVMMGTSGPSSAAATTSSVQAAQSSSAPASAPVTNTTNDLRFLSAESVSATGVLLRFTHPVSIPPASALDAIVIQTASGTVLRMTRFTVQNTTILVDTEPQQRGIVYRVTVRPVISGRNSNGQTIGLAPDQENMLFIGHPTGIAPTSQPSGTQTSSAAPASNKPEVAQLRLRAQPDGAKTYKVEVTWTAPAGNVSGYQIAQSTDGGRTYSQPLSVAKEATAASIPGVTPGTFGVMIRTMYSDGTASTGITQLINLPVAGTPVQGSVTPGQPTNGGALPNSGATFWVAIIGAAGALGAFRMRRLVPENVQY